MPVSSRSVRRARRLAACLTMVVALVPITTVAQVEGPPVIVATDQIVAGLYSPQQWYSAEHIRALNNASGKQISLGGLWFNVNEPLANMIYMLEEVWSAGATPFVNIHVDAYPADIAAGHMDTYIATVGNAVSQFLSQGEGRAVLLAPMPEMNGDWVVYGMDPTNFKEAFRHFVSVASQNGASGRVRWVFAPNGWSTQPYRMADYYPGADSVDLVGFSAYNWGSSDPGLRWTTVAETLCGPLNEARSFAREKPFLVAQTASSEVGGDRDVWIEGLFDFLVNDPNVVGFLYFNIDKEHDWAIYRGDEVAAGWQQGMQSEQTVYQFPLNDWFVPGPLVVDTANEPYVRCFADIGQSQFQSEIGWLVNVGITVGCAEAYFCPKRGVTRAQMASFLVRSLGLVSAVTDYFSDDNGSIHEADINAIAQAGITTGCGVGTFCPGTSMNRAQMATFLTRGFGLPASGVDYFSDDNGSVHEADTNAVALAGITTGCGGTSFCPAGTVTREQMAAFLYRALQ
jgi:hypothetical protein